MSEVGFYEFTEPGLATLVYVGAKNLSGAGIPAEPDEGHTGLLWADEAISGQRADRFPRRVLWLGTLKDANGRYLLTPNPAEPHQLRLCVGPHTLPVKTYDNDTIPTASGKIPMILGDLKEGVVYWDRRHFSVRVSDVAVVGDFNAFEQDMTIWRGSLRDDCTG